MVLAIQRQLIATLLTILRHWISPRLIMDLSSPPPSWVEWVLHVPCKRAHRLHGGDSHFRSCSTQLKDSDHQMFKGAGWRRLICSFVDTEVVNKNDDENTKEPTAVETGNLTPTFCLFASWGFPWWKRYSMQRLYVPMHLYLVNA